MITREHENRSVEELQRLLEYYIFSRDHFAETYSERSDLNKEIRAIKSEIFKRDQDV